MARTLAIVMSAGAQLAPDVLAQRPVRSTDLREINPADRGAGKAMVGRLFLVGDAGTEVGEAALMTLTSLHARLTPGPEPNDARAAGLLTVEQRLVDDFRSSRLTAAEKCDQLDSAVPLPRVLEEMQLDLKSGKPAAIVWLGDNVYRSGVADAPKCTDIANLRSGREDFVDSLGLTALGANWCTERLTLKKQVDASDGATRVIFVAGNHDWDGDKAQRVCNAAMALSEIAAKKALKADHIVLAPDRVLGCPGPQSMTLDFGNGNRIPIIAIDTEALLTESRATCEMQCDKTTSCPPGRFEDRLKAAVSAGGAMSIVVAHHPLRTYGKHSNASKNWLDKVEDAITSLISSQDITDGKYKKLIITPIERALKDTKPLAYVAGHDHNLFLSLDPSLGYWTAVSGAGGKKGEVQTTPDELKFHSRVTHDGYMVLEFYPGNRVELAVVEVKRDDANAKRETRYFLMRP